MFSIMGTIWHRNSYLAVCHALTPQEGFTPSVFSLVQRHSSFQGKAVWISCSNPRPLWAAWRWKQIEAWQAPWHSHSHGKSQNDPKAKKWESTWEGGLFLNCLATVFPFSSLEEHVSHQPAFHLHLQRSSRLQFGSFSISQINIGCILYIVNANGDLHKFFDVYWLTQYIYAQEYFNEF